MSSSYNKVAAALEHKARQAPQQSFRTYDDVMPEEMMDDLLEDAKTWTEWKTPEGMIYGKKFRGHRRQCAYWIPGAPRERTARAFRYKFSGMEVVADRAPPSLVDAITVLCERMQIPMPNYVFCNWYSDKGDYIGPHSDADMHPPMIFGEPLRIEKPPIISLSVGRNATFRVKPNKKPDGALVNKSTSYKLRHGTIGILPYDVNETTKHEVPVYSLRRDGPSRFGDTRCNFTGRYL